MNTKTSVGILSLAIAAITAVADVHTGQMVANPYMTDNYNDWSGNAPWRNNGGSKNQVHDFEMGGSAGFASAFAAARDLTTDPAITMDPLYDGSTTKLTDLSLGDVWVLIPNWNVGNIGAGLDARFYVEVDISTVSGNDYRASSNKLTVDGNLTSGGYAQAFSIANWATYTVYDGNPFDGGAGIALDDINTVTYKWVMQTITPNTDGAGTVFFQADNAVLNYEVTTIPEPSTLGLLALCSTGILGIRRIMM